MIEPATERLQGGMSNAGAVVKVGETVRRPTSRHAHATTTLLHALHAAGFPAPVPLDDGRSGVQSFRWVPGAVPIQPFPSWSMSEEALASVGRLLRRYHDTAATLALPNDLDWCRDLADPAGGAVICHNDICPENIVFEGVRATALLDFDFAAPGRPEWDLAQAARMWVPLRPAAFNGDRAHLDPFRRLRVLTDAYGLCAAARESFVEAIVESRRVGNHFLARRVQAGEPAFIAAWERHGGATGTTTILRWLEDNTERFLAALTPE